MFAPTALQLMRCVPVGYFSATGQQYGSVREHETWRTRGCATAKRGTLILAGRHHRLYTSTASPPVYQLVVDSSLLRLYQHSSANSDHFRRSLAVSIKLHIPQLHNYQFTNWLSTVQFSAIPASSTNLEHFSTSVEVNILTKKFYHNQKVQVIIKNAF